MQIVDRIKLLPPPWGSGVTCGSIRPRSRRLPAPIHTAELGELIMNPDNGAHTSWPLGKIIVPDFVTDTGNDDDNTTRDIVVVASEATAHFCSEFRHLTFMTDVTDRGQAAVDRDGAGPRIGRQVLRPRRSLRPTRDQ